RLVPVGQTESARGGANVRFRHACLQEGKAHAPPDRRTVPGTVVADVVRGGAVGEVLQAELAANRLQGFEQLLLAVVAAVGMVLRVSLELELVGRYLDQ